MKNEYDVIVVGGGPAGATCATYLGMKNTDVLLVDKHIFPRDKPCGDALTLRALSVLRELGIEFESDLPTHQKVNGILIYAPNGQRLHLDFRNYFGLVCRRSDFDNLLFQLAKKHVEVIEQFLVTDLIFEDSKVVGIKGLKSGSDVEKSIRAKIVVGADGAYSVVARKLGFRRNNPKHYALAIRAYYSNIKGLSDKWEILKLPALLPSYLWIFPLGKDTANVGLGSIARLMQKRKINLKSLLFKELSTNPLLKERFEHAKLISEPKGWSLPLISSRTKIFGNGFLLIGDAGSLIDPLTGEGIGNGMLSAKIASQVIIDALEENDFSERKLATYTELLKQELKTEIKTSEFLCMMGKSTFFTNIFDAKARRNERLRNALLEYFMHAEHKGKLTRSRIIKYMLFS